MTKKNQKTTKTNTQKNSWYAQSTPNVIHLCPHCPRYVNTLTPDTPTLCSRYVKRLFLLCQHSVPIMSIFGNVIHQCPRCSRYVNALFPFCQHYSRYVNALFPFCKTFFPLCQHSVPVMSTLGKVIHHCPRCPRCVNTLFTLCQHPETSSTTVHAVPVMSALCSHFVNTLSVMSARCSRYVNTLFPFRQRSVPVRSTR